MEMPKPQEQHRKLQALAGRWTGEEKIHPSPWDPQGGGATATVEARLELDGFFLVMNYTQQRGGRTSYRGLGVFGYDAEGQQYTLHWFDSMGSPVKAPATGTWKGDTLGFENTTPMGRSRYVYTFQAEGRFAFRIEHSADGQKWAPFLEGQYTRRT